MVSNTLSTAISESDRHTVWGLEPMQLHDRFWAARGVEVVRQGQPSEIVQGAELFLLTAPDTMAMFKLNQLIETLSWVKPVLLYVRVHDDREHGYLERAVTSDNDRFVRFERIYGNSTPRGAGGNGSETSKRVALTAHREVALAWQTSDNLADAWRRLRRSINADQCTAVKIDGRIYDDRNGEDTVQFIRTLVSTWKQPDSTIQGARRVGAHAWADPNVQIDPGTSFVGPVWVGAGRRVDVSSSVVGPAVLWDDPEARPQIESLQWDQIEPSEVFARPIHPQEQSVASRKAKRLFDVVFALCVLAMTLPFYPLIMLAIFLEDGLPFFFQHQRETLGGRLFGCIKFRSMRRDADAIKALLAEHNRADGPQFFLEDDPRLTKVGRFLRRANIDELPQFINVLLGDMSVVGPRPSPHEENQFCPAWREARLSIRPGITGLWQVSRSRLEGKDFQEWIKYDIEYVEHAGWRLDLWIIWKTIPIVLHGVLR